MLHPGQSSGAFAALLGLLWLDAALPSQATTYPLASPTDAVVGADQTVTTVYEDTLYDLARTYSLGSEELIRVNPGVDPWLPGAGKVITIPGPAHSADRVRARASSSTCPNTGSTTTRSRCAASRQQVITYPVSIGKMDWHTPIGLTHVIAKTKNPTWYPPESVRKEHAAAGDPLPAVRAARSRQSARCVRHAARGRQRHLHDPWHQQSDCRRACGHARLHPHVSGRCRGAVSADSGRHAGAHRQRAGQGRLGGRRAVARGASAGGCRGSELRARRRSVLARCCRRRSATTRSRFIGTTRAKCCRKPTAYWPPSGSRPICRRSMPADPGLRSPRARASRRRRALPTGNVGK